MSAQVLSKEQRTTDVEKRLMECLELVGVAFLVEREGGFTRRFSGFFIKGGFLPLSVIVIVEEPIVEARNRNHPYCLIVKPSRRPSRRRRLDGRRYGGRDGRRDGRPDGRLDGRPDGQRDGRSDGRCDGRLHGRRDSCRTSYEVVSLPEIQSYCMYTPDTR